MNIRHIAVAAVGVLACAAPFAGLAKQDSKGSPSGCERRVSATTWGMSNPRGAPSSNATPPPQANWNDVDSCVEDGMSLMFRDGWADDELVHVAQWRHADAEAFTQAWGFDIGAVRVFKTTSGYGWSFFRDGMSQADGNTAWVVYGKPVYAMTSGWVARCWRNAPENPAPPAVQRWDNRVPGSGNYIMIEEPDGDRVFYAHAIPESIPAELCPHNAELFSTSSSDTVALQDPEAVVPVEQRVWVNAGQFLMRVGNSGQSTGPHLHVHKHRLDPTVQPVSMGFLQYDWLPAATVPSTFNWNRVTGQPLPPGPFVLRISGDAPPPPVTEVGVRPGARSWVDGYARYGTNIGGRIDLEEPDPALCERACTDNANCRSWTYVKPGWQAKHAVCWIKSDAPEPVPDKCCATGDVPG